MRYKPLSLASSSAADLFLNRKVFNLPLWPGFPPREHGHPFFRGNQSTQLRICQGPVLRTLYGTWLHLSPESLNSSLLLKRALGFSTIPNYSCLLSPHRFEIFLVLDKQQLEEKLEVKSTWLPCSNHWMPYRAPVCTDKPKESGLQGEDEKT